MKGIPLISQFFLVGDARKYCSGLVTLDVSAILRDKFGMDGAHSTQRSAQQIALLNEQGHQLSEYTGSADIHAEIEAQVMELNKQFAPPEQVKKFTILPRDFTVDDGELTQHSRFAGFKFVKTGRMKSNRCTRGPNLSRMRTVAYGHRR